MPSNLSTENKESFLEEIVASLNLSENDNWNISKVFEHLIKFYKK